MDSTRSLLMADRNLEDVRIEVTPGIDLTGKIVFEDGSPPNLRNGSMSVFLPNMGDQDRQSNRRGFSDIGCKFRPWRLYILAASADD